MRLSLHLQIVHAVPLASRCPCPTVLYHGQASCRRCRWNVYRPARPLWRPSKLLQFEERYEGTVAGCFLSAYVLRYQNPNNSQYCNQMPLLDRRMDCMVTRRSNLFARRTWRTVVKCPRAFRAWTSRNSPWLLAFASSIVPKCVLCVGRSYPRRQCCNLGNGLSSSTRCEETCRRFSRIASRAANSV